MSTAKRETRTPAPEATGPRALAGKYLTFVLAQGEYGLSVRKVREIIKLMPITTVPHVAPWIKGVINLRGKIIPVVDLRLKFQLPAAEWSDRTCIIVTEVATRQTAVPVGIIVDSVSDVLNISDEEFEATPDFGDQSVSAHFEGLAKIKGTVKIILNLDHVCDGVGETATWAPSVA